MLADDIIRKLMWRLAEIHEGNQDTDRMVAEAAAYLAEYSPLGTTETPIVEFIRRWDQERTTDATRAAIRKLDSNPHLYGELFSQVYLQIKDTLDAVENDLRKRFLFHPKISRLWNR